jgi:hypothetical protein
MPSLARWIGLSLSLSLFALSAKLPAQLIRRLER